MLQWVHEFKVLSFQVSQFPKQTNGKMVSFLPLFTDSYLASSTPEPFLLHMKLLFLQGKTRNQPQ